MNIKNDSHVPLTKLDFLVVLICLTNFFVPFLLRELDVSDELNKFLYKGEIFVAYYVLTYGIIIFVERKIRSKKRKN